MSADDIDVTRLLRAWQEGSEEAEARLWPVLYRELKGLARLVLAGRRRSGGPQTSTLVHEACLRLMGSDAEWNDRRHFLAVAARAMRFVLVDEARRRLARKRVPEASAGELPEEVPDPTALRAHEVLGVHRALDRLAEVNPRYVKLVELRYFSGLTVDETARVLGVSRPTVVRDWRAARVWLHGQMQGQGDVA